MTVVIVDYGSGNLRSAAKAFERAADDLGLGLDVMVSSSASDVEAASHVVLPGVGAFADCKAGLAALDGMEEALEQTVISGGTPFMGICVGMQLMAEFGREHGEHVGLGWIEGAVEPMKPADKALKIPHMGWNELHLCDPGHPLFNGLDNGAHVYFVHGYHMVCDNPTHVLATADYGGAVTAAVGRDNMVGTQFHPEKSQAVGLKLIGNFLKWKP